jgi:hypothetical protein
MGRNTLTDLSGLTRQCKFPLPGETEKAGPIGSHDLSKIIGGKFAYCLSVPEIPADELPDGQSIEYSLIISDHSAFAEGCIRHTEPFGRQVGVNGNGAPAAFFALRHPDNHGGQFATLQITCSKGAKPDARGVDMFVAVW